MSGLIEYQKRNLEYREQLIDEYSSLSEEYNNLYKLSDKLINILKNANGDMNSSDFDKISKELDLTVCAMKANRVKSSTIYFALDLHQKIVK